MKSSLLYRCAILLLMLCTLLPAEPSVVKIEKTDGGFQLMHNGRPYFINGAGGGSRMEDLVKAGGNSIRTWSSSQRTLDRADEHGLSVCMGLRLALPRHGADYANEQMLAEQRQRIADEVTALKDHPALLMWAIGNEPEHEISREAALPVWDEIERIAQLIKSIDANHPVITVLAGAGPKLEDIRRRCPSLDAVGINSYGSLAKVPGQVERFGWDKPYLITEFGPRGWWEVDRTPWGLPIEDTSTVYDLANHAIAAHYVAAADAGVWRAGVISALADVGPAHPSLERLVARLAAEEGTGEELLLRVTLGAFGPRGVLIRCLDRLPPALWPQAIERALANLDAEDPEVAAAALLAAGRLRSVDLVQRVEALALDRQESEVVRAAALTAWGDVGYPDQRTVGVLIRLLEDPEYEVRREAHHALVTLTGLRMGGVPDMWRRWRRTADLPDAPPEPSETRLARLRQAQAQAWSAP